MADGIKISALTETVNINGDEYIIINQDGTTKRTMFYFSQFKKLISCTLENSIPAQLCLSLGR